jgi:flagellar motility protein MotE (MotC chaperone)
MYESLRILRVVIVSALILLGVKAIDLFAGNSALASDQGPEAAAAPPHETDAVKVETPAPKETPKPDAAKPEAPAASSAPDLSTMSRSEIEVLQNLASRRQELEERGRELDMREKLLKASEQRIDEHIAELKGIEANIQSLLQQRDAAQEARLASLVKVYEGMKPADAARIFDKLEMDILLPVAQRMKAQKIAQVMAAMDEDAAKRLTVNLAQRLNGKVPEATQPVAPDAAPVAPPVPTQGG